MSDDLRNNAIDAARIFARQAAQWKDIDHDLAESIADSFVKIVLDTLTADGDAIVTRTEVVRVDNTGWKAHRIETEHRWRLHDKNSVHMGGCARVWAEVKQ